MKLKKWGEGKRFFIIDKPKRFSKLTKGGN